MIERVGLLVYTLSMKIGIFGGTFAPPHNAHKLMVNSAIEQIGLDIVFVLPNGVPPHKTTELNATDRVRLTHLMFDNLPKIKIDEYEIMKGGASYTFLTLEHYKEMFPSDELFLIIGGDSLRDFDTWANPKTIVSLAKIVVCQRKNVEFDKCKKAFERKYKTKVMFVEMEESDVSSTDIRIDYEFGVSCLDRVPEKINDYILQNNLFCEFKSMIEKLKTYLFEKRFSHTYYVVKAGLSLKTKIPYEKVFVACLLHDCAKYMEESDWERYDYHNEEHFPPKVVHSALGAKVAERDFNITDKDILEAIYYHTTGKPNMSELDMIVYIADKIEQSRPYETKHLMGKTIEETFYRCICEANRLKVSKGQVMHPLTKETIDYYKAKYEGEIDE